MTASFLHLIYASKVFVRIVWRPRPTAGPAFSCGGCGC